MFDRFPIWVCLGVLAFSISANAATVGGFWRDIDVTETSRDASAPAPALPQRYRLLRLDVDAFREGLPGLPPEQPTDTATAGLLIVLPLPEGGFREFVVVATELMPWKLARKYPEIRTYSGYAKGDTTVTLRLDFTPAGLHAMVTTASGVFHIDPYRHGDLRDYLCFYKKDATAARRKETPADFIDNPAFRQEMQALRQRAVQGTLTRAGRNIRTYRIAIAATGEYTRYHGGTVALGLAAVVTALNRVTGIYEQELAVRFQLVADNDLIIYTDPAGDPYTNGDPYSLLLQNQATLDGVVGSNNYDIGHVFSTGGGGLAYVGVLCGAWKARGETGLRAPDGDAFWVDYVAHEIGHQMGAYHTFNSPLGACQGNREAGSAYEIGSGSTIMAYAGICSSDNLQPHSDPYFHGQSFDQIRSVVQYGSGSQCGRSKASGNAPPVPRVGASGLYIPALTPFMLSGSGTDQDGDALTYSWEESDLGPEISIAGTMDPVTAPDDVPLFRAFPPTKTAKRIFPELASLVAGVPSWGEVLPSSARSLSFRLVARDSKGGVGTSTIKTLMVTDAAGPFKVTEPNSSLSWKIGPQQGTVRWDVAKTDQPPVSCAAVDIFLSTNGGTTFGKALARGTENDGVAVVDVPNRPTRRARISVFCSRNQFFDISDVDFAVAR